MLGCTNSTACNYNPNANCDDDSCLPVPTCNDDPCAGDITELSADGCSCELVEPQMLGCTNSTACNYNPNANCDDDSCLPVPTCNDDPCLGDTTALSADGCSCELVEPQELGCTNSAACNYNPNANCDDESCLPVPTCNDDPCAGDTTELSADGCSCEIVEPQMLGCTNSTACNYNPNANCDDESCLPVPTCNDDPCAGDITALNADACSCELVEPQIKDCTDPTAINCNPNANCSDDTMCEYDWTFPECNFDGCMDVADCVAEYTFNCNYDSDLDLIMEYSENGNPFQPINDGDVIQCEAEMCQIGIVIDNSGSANSYEVQQSQALLRLVQLADLYGLLVP